MDRVVYGERRQPYVLWRVGALAVVLSGVLATGLTYAAVADARGERRATVIAAVEGGLTAGATSPAGCADALARAEEVLAEAHAVDRALAAQVQAVNEVLAGRTTAQQALDRTLADLTRGAQRSTALAEAEQRYRTALPACR